jgi:hypothetical protein
MDIIDGFPFRYNPLYKYPKTKIGPQNREQEIAYSLLYDPTITNVMIAGHYQLLMQVIIK